MSLFYPFLFKHISVKTRTYKHDYEERYSLSETTYMLKWPNKDGSKLRFKEIFIYVNQNHNLYSIR